MSTEPSEHIFKKVNVGLVVVLSILTMGIYVGYWFLKERRTLRNMDYKGLIPIKLWWVVTFFLCLSFLFNLIGEAIFTPYGYAMISSLDIIFTFYYLGILYYSVFRMRDVIEARFVDVYINPWLLVFLHVWYLQYKINRLEGLKSENWEEALQQ
ncbi:hypothetical protein ACNQFZ_09735 [Schinkia sp. CFF1]